MIFLKKIKTIRINSQIEKEINEIVNSNCDKYFNLSHFIRVAIMKLIKEEKEKVEK